MAISPTNTEIQSVLLNQSDMLKAQSQQTLDLSFFFFTNKQTLRQDSIALSHFREKVDSCLLECSEIQNNPESKVFNEILSSTKESLTTLQEKAIKFASSSLELPMLLQQIVADFKRDKITPTLQNFLKLEQKLPSLANSIYTNMWKLKGCPMGDVAHFGRCAFFNLEGNHSLLSEKAEAILMHTHPIQGRFTAVQNLLAENSELQALKQFKELASMHPLIAEHVFKKLWEIYDKPTKANNPSIACADFGKITFYNQHPKVTYDPIKKAHAIEQALLGLKPLFDDSAFWNEQDSFRCDVHCTQVMQQQINLLEKGAYISPLGKKCQIDVKKSIESTKVYYSGGNDTAPKKPRFANTLLEVRPENCVATAHRLASDENNCVNIMNVGDPYRPGGNYLLSTGAQEEELCRCTGLSFALDSSHNARETLYPLPNKVGVGGGIYTRTELFRSGRDQGHELYEMPLPISITTLYTYKEPNLNFDDLENPLLEGAQLRWTRERVRTYLHSAYTEGDNILIMGAFGCGLLGNPPGHLAEIIMDVIQKEYANCFKQIIFCIMPNRAVTGLHNPQGSFTPFANAVKKAGGQAYDIHGQPL